MTTIVRYLFSLLPLSKYRVTGQSMIPTYQEEDILLVNRLAYLFSQPKVNDCVVLKDPRNSREILKRITKVGKGGYFVEGDNKKESTDSREFGWIQRRNIIGKVLSIRV